MLKQLGNLIQKRPWLVVTFVFLITIGFSTLLPSLEMKTSTEDFMPDDEIVNASLRINSYFGQTGESIMIFVEKQNAENVVIPLALKEEYQVLKDLEGKFDEIKGTISVASFVDILCNIEFGDTFINLTDEQIITAYNDIMAIPETDEKIMLQEDDPNEKADYDPYPLLPGEDSFDSLDVKNYFIEVDNETFIFSIEVYDLSAFKNELSTPHRKINTWEWFIDFNNLITPDERLKMDYSIAAHVEPSEPIWEVGKGLFNNLKAFIDIIKNGQLFKSYKSELVLWIKAPGQDISFPIILKTGNITFDTDENKIIMEVEKEELGRYGIAPKFGTFELPAKIANTKAGVKIFQTPILNKPWRRVTFNISFIEKLVKGIQNRPILGSIVEKLMQRFGEFTWEDFDAIFEMLNSNEFAIDTFSSKDLSFNWITLDVAPNKGISDAQYFIKPPFIEDLKTASIAFLSEDYVESSGPSSTLMIIHLNSSMEMMGLDILSMDIQTEMISLDSKESYVSMKASGNGIITNDMNEVTEEANMIIMPGIFIVICLILLVMFKRLSYVILPILSLTISIIWLFGTMVLLGINFNMMMVAIVPLLMGLGVDYSVHLFHNYRSELKKGKDPASAIVASITDVGMAMMLATITTVIAFLSFLTATVPPLRHFGILCAIGIIYTFITAITLQASVRYILDRKRHQKVIPKENNKISLDKYMERFSNVILKFRKIILVFAVIITVFMVSGATQVETTFDMNDFLPEGTESLDLMMNIGEYFPSSSENQEYILIEGDVATVVTLEGIAKTYENLKDDSYVSFTPTGDPKESSILSIIRKAARDNSTLKEKFNLDDNSIPKNNADVVAFYDYLYNHLEYLMEARSVLHQDGGYYDATVIRIYTASTFSNDDSIDTNKQSGILYDELNADMENYGDTKSVVTGMSSAMYTIMGSMTDSQILSTVVSVILASLVLIIVFRNPTLGLVTVLPVGICIMWIIGTIYFLGYSFNIMTIMVTSLTIGIGIDYAIHATQRFRLTADRTGDVKEAVSATIGHTGGALFIAALTTAAGFGMLILAPMPPEQQFGIITSMTIVYSYITSILILPPILLKWGEWQKKKKGYIISPKSRKKD